MVGVYSIVCRVSARQGIRDHVSGSAQAKRKKDRSTQSVRKEKGGCTRTREIEALSNAKLVTETVNSKIR